MDSPLVNLMLTNDGTTLVTVREGNDGSLELLTTPVTIVHQTPQHTPQLFKVSNNQSSFNHVQLNNVSKINQELNTAPIQVTSLQSQNINIADKENSNLMQKTNVPLEKSPICNFTDCNFQDDCELILTDDEQNVENLSSEQIPSSTTGTSVKRGKNSASKKCGRKTLGKSRKSNKSNESACYKCDICGQQFKKQYLLQKHTQDHAQEKPHHCPKCTASFNVPTNFTLHMATHSIGEPKCPECGRKFARMASLRSHMIVHEVDENLYCTECDDVFTAKTQLEAHLRLHNEKWSPDDYRRCKLCRKQFTQPVLYKQHLRDHYKLQTKCIKQTKRGIRHRTGYKCKICLKAFEKPSQLTRHIRVHTGEKPYKCHLCNRRFTQKGSVRVHLWQHNGIKPYCCSFCNSTFSQKSNLNSHIHRVHKVEEGAPIYRCTKCPCIFKKLGSLNGHIKRSHNNESRNDEEQAENEVRKNVEDIEPESPNVSNNNATKNNNQLPKNIEDGIVVTEDKETAVVTLLDKTSAEGKYIKIKQRTVNNSKFYECSFCDKKFKKPSDLIRHLRIHTRERPFKCKTCNRSFTLKSTMLAHQKVHDKLKKFLCDFCKSFFNSESELLNHMKKHNKRHICAICNTNFNSFGELKTHSKEHLSKNANLKNRDNLDPEIENLVPNVVLKEPLILTEAGDGLLHAQPKYRNEVAHGKGRPHKCSVCSAAFMKLSHLKQHHRRHTGERPYLCLNCNRRFTSGSALKAHRRTHDLSKPYECTICDKRFSTLSSMKRHLNTHSNKRPIMCPYCNKTFKTTENCRKHMKMHKNEIILQQVKEKQQQAYNLNSGKPETMTKSIVNGKEINYQPIKTISIASPTQINQRTLQNLSIVNNPNIDSSQTLHATETGTITLSNCMGEQTLTPESIKEIEETLNQQLYNIGMNLALNNTVRQIEEHHNVPLEVQNQPILSIIYEGGKTLDSPLNTSMNASAFFSQFDTFDINQMALQNDMGITQSNSTSMASILPKSNQENQCYNLINKDNYTANDFTKDNNNETQLKNNVDEESNLECHMCKQQGFTANNLKEHLKTHQGSREFECPHCSSTFCSSGGLSRHIKIHQVKNTEETHKCYECNKEFPTSKQLREHIKDIVKHELKLKNLEEGESIEDDIKLSSSDAVKKNNKCKYCPKTFRKPSDLIRHIRTHTGERPYPCKHCNKSFAVKCTLDAHLKIHNGEKSFHCHVCNNKLATRGSLKVHMRLHTGAKPFKCPICDMKFRTSGHRKVHMISHTREPGSSCSRKSKKEQKMTDTATESKLEPAKEESIIKIVHTEPVLQQTVTLPDSQTIDDNQLLNTITINSDNDQITFNTDETPGFLSLNDNQLVANLQYYLTNGLVTIQTEDPTLLSTTTQVPLPSVTDVGNIGNNFETTNIVQTMEDQVTSQQIVYSMETPNEISAMTNEGNFDINQCLVLQLENVDSTVPDIPVEKPNTKQKKSLSNATRRECNATRRECNATRRECDVCGKAFAKPCQLKRHKRIHTGERPFKCEICDKAFTQKSTLQMHQKFHTGDRPYSCPECAHTFTQSGNLHTHLKRIHKINVTRTKNKNQQFVFYEPESSQQNFDESRGLNFDDLSFSELLK